MRKLRLSWRKKAKFETLKSFGGLKTYLRRLEKSLFQTAQENQLVVTKKYNKHNQKLTEIVVVE